MRTAHDVILPSDVFDLPVDPVTLFARSAPVELEIGCGKGGFLLRQARANPDRNYLGIERANAIYKFAADRMARWGVENVRIVRADARQVVLRGLTDASLAGLHVYHPDPWPKRRHARRRLIQPDFVDAAVRVLRPGARWAIQTDHADYFEQIRPLLVAHEDLDEVPFNDPEAGITEDGLTETNFETKYLREGRTILRIAMRKRPARSDCKSMGTRPSCE
jgi:tRNA (guanine-N7-)-methyltransferase